MPSLADLMDEMADTLHAVVGPAVGAETEVQVTGRMNPNPTPPSIDIYPGDPFRDTPTQASKKSAARCCSPSGHGSPPSTTSPAKTCCSGSWTTKTTSPWPAP